MAVLVYAETQGNKVKKAALECVFYGKKVADAEGAECIALVLGSANGVEELGNYGADRVIQISDASLDQFDSMVHTSVIGQVVDATSAQTVILAHSSTGKSLLGRLSAKLSAGSVSGVIDVPSYENGFTVKKSVFSGKAIAEFKVKTDKRVLTLSGNSFKPEEIGTRVDVEHMDVTIPTSSVKVIEVKREEGTVPLPEAELVVSAGRGMKGPENWGIIEELANELGATTACSRPVADIGWRPHHEHVGQTGVAIKPNLYIAAGISGAIQHLAGVNNSKVIVVINKDSEAPFFKAADYGVLGDLFEVVPKLTEAVKKFKAGL
ncbi:MAG: electron transfer flavoprotein subunit alpha/FixB family protein [Saprospiraceae bacterium]|nr:electron transfer flavoprotein subunit alpha/FixB family protein [Saprospiraceae bacterium]